MSRFKNLFGKNPAPQPKSPSTAKAQHPKTRPVSSEESGTVADALSEIESEDFSLDSGRIEDQLVELESFEPAMTSEQPDEVGSEIEGVKRTVAKIEGESKALHSHLSRLEKDLGSLITSQESLASKISQSMETKREPIRIQVPVQKKERFMPFRPQRKEEPVEVDDELPPFHPGMRDTVSFDFAPARGSLPAFPSFSTVAESQSLQIEEFRPGVKSTTPEPVTSAKEGGPILTRIPKDYLSLTLVMRWIEFLFERITRDKISLALDYYVEIGWISEDAKHEVMSIARGEMQDVTKYMASEEVATAEEALEELPEPVAPSAIYKKIEDWRLAADDHLKSLLFICNIAGIKVDKDKLNSLELMISRFKENLENFHGV